MAPTELTAVVAREQVEAAGSCSHVPSEENGAAHVSGYEGNLAPVNVG